MADGGTRPSLRVGMLILGLGMVLNSGLTMVLMRVYSDRYGQAELSAFMLLRVWCTFILGVSSLGMPIALQRTVAFLSAAPGRAGTAALVGLAIGTAGVGCVSAASALMAPWVAVYLDYPPAGPLWRASMALMFSQTFAGLVSYIQLARGRVLEYTAVTLAAFSVASVIPVLLSPHASLSTVLLQSAVMASFTPAFSLVEICTWSARNGVSDVVREAKGLLVYGLPRTVASMIEPVVEMLVPFLAFALGASLVDAGGLAMGLALLRPFNTVTGILSLILVSETARMVSLDGGGAEANRVRQVSELSLQFGVFASLQLFVWCDVLITLWLGHGYETVTGTIRVMSLSLAPTFVYGSLRGIIDGGTERAVNTGNLVISLATLVGLAFLLSLVHRGTVSLAVAFLVSKTVLGALTLRYILQSVEVNVVRTILGVSVLLSLSLGLIALVLRSVIPVCSGPLGMAALCSLSTVVFVSIMAHLGAGWALRILPRLGFPR